MNVDSLEAGRELDALVAERVMGWTRGVAWLDSPEQLTRWYDANGPLDAQHATPEGEGGGDYYYPDTAWSPSTSIAAAWEVVEKRLSTDGHFAFWPSLTGFTVAFHGIRTWDSEPLWEVWAETAPLAICRAALKAVGA